MLILNVAFVASNGYWVIFEKNESAVIVRSSSSEVQGQ